MLEAELLAAGLLLSRCDADGRETLQLTPAGVQLLAETVHNNRAARGPHEALVARVASEMQRAGRVVWRGLSLRAWVGEQPSQVLAMAAGLPAQEANRGSSLASGARAAQAGAVSSADLPGFEPAKPTPQGAAHLSGSGAQPGGHWAMAMPDVFSIRHTTVEAYLAPVAHEVKVRRADLLADLRRPAKGEAYRWLAGECWYVIREGIAHPDEIPLVYGVLVAPAQGPLWVARPAPQRSTRLPFAVWMALARATPEALPEAEQGWLAPEPGAHADQFGGQFGADLP
jgi:hypothetical protein